MKKLLVITLLFSSFGFCSVFDQTLNVTTLKCPNTNNRGETIFLRINEKPKYSELVSAGIYILNNKILKKLKKNKKCDVPELLNSIKENIKIYPIFEHWIDVGEASKLNQALNFYVKRKK